MRKLHALLCLLLLATPLLAAERVALVIGNGAYSSAPLGSPVGDARAMEQALTKLGFSVTRIENADRAQMMRGVQQFRSRLRAGGIGLFYYSGHGVEIEGKNYLLPVGGSVQTQEDVLVEALDAGYVVAQMEAAGGALNLVVLDACRNNPLPATTKAVGKGLARMDGGTGTLVAFATAAGQVAEDGGGALSPYTAALLQQLPRPGLSVAEVFNETNLEVARQTGNRQRPWYSTSGVPTVRLAGVGTVVQPSPTLPAGEGEIRLTVSPSEASVRINGALAGSGSRTIRRAAGTELTVRVEASGHESLEERLVVEGGQVADVTLRLKPIGGASRPDPVVTRPEPVAASSVPLPALVEVPAGSFQMGSPSYEGDRESDEGPVRDVRVKAFRLGKYEVTRGEFGRFVSATGYRTDAERNTAVGGSAEGCFAYKGGTDFGWKAGTSWRDPGYAQEDDHPVVCVSWNDAQEYVKWLNGETGRRYRLPSEAEQEYAIRATSRTAYVWGNDANGACAYANVADASAKGRFSGATTVSCNDGSVFTRSVGRYEANRFGLYDTVGNVWEWGQDCYRDSYPDAPVDGSAYDAGGCERRVLRGAAWNFAPTGLRSAFRNWIHPTNRNISIGFRLAEDL